MSATRSFFRTVFTCSVLAAVFAPASAAAQSLVGTLPVDVSVDNKGAANATIPLQIPAGRGGMQPKLALVYNSQGGNGPLGIGWSVSTGFPQGITRGRSILARDGVTRGVNFDANDKFYLDGKRLICTSGTYGLPGSTYRTEVDSFVTITTTGTGANIETFVVTDSSGHKQHFGKFGGKSDGYQVLLGDGNDDGVIMPGELDSRAYTYALSRVEDAVSNYCDFSYTHNGKGAWYLSEIVYTGAGGSAVAPHARVVLDYELREDTLESFIAQRNFLYDQRLKNLRAFTDNQESLNYSLTYEYAPFKGPSRLKSISLAGGVDAPQSFTCPPTLFTWSDKWATTASPANMVSIATAPHASPILAPTPTNGSQKHGLHYGDFNGDGKQDYMDVNYAGPYGERVIKVELNNGVGGFHAPQTWSSDIGFLNNNPGYSPEFCYSYPADINGDGRQDVVLVNAKFQRAYALVSNGTQFVGLDGGSAPTLVCDIEGQRLVSDMEGSVKKETHLLRDAAGQAMGGRMTVADFTGDSRDDILVHGFDGYMYVLVSYGTGFHSPRQSVARSITSSIGETGGWRAIFAPYIYSSVKATELYMITGKALDVDGDGILDYVWTEKAEMYSYSNGTPVSYVNLRGTRAACGSPDGTILEKTEVDTQIFSGGVGSLLYKDAYYATFPADYNGDGLSDFLVFSSKGILSQRWLLYAGAGRNANGSPRFLLIPGPMQGDTFTVGNDTMRTWCSPIIEQPVPGQPGYWTGWGLNYPPGYPQGGLSPEERGKLFFGIVGSAGESMTVADMNGDGLSDLVWYVDRKHGGPEVTDASNRGWWVAYSRGRKFSEPQRIALDLPGNIVPGSDPRNFSAQNFDYGQDYNGDGIPDFNYRKSEMGLGKPFTTLAIGVGPLPNLLTTITDGIGRKTDIAYKAAKDSSIYTPGVPVSYPIRELHAPTPVVSDIYKDSGTASTTDRAHFSYQYSGNRLDLSGRGGLGFHSFVTIDRQTNLFKYQFLTQSFPMTGLTAREQTFRFWETGAGESAQVHFRLISSHDNTVVFDEVVNGANTSQAYGTVYPFMSKAIESRWENSATAHFTFSAGGPSAKPELLFPIARPTGAHITISAHSWFDNQSLSASPPTTLPGSYSASDRTTDWSLAGTNTVTGIADYATFDALTFPRQITHGNLRQLSTDFGDGFNEKVVTTYHTPTSNGLTGLVDTVTTTVSSASHGTESAPVKSYTYETIGSTPTPLVKTETIDATDNTLDLTTTYTRDTLGRVTATEISGYNNPGHPQHIGTFTTSTVTAFDARFDLPTTSKNAYGHTTTVAYHPFFGTPTSVTAVNDAQTTTTYDAIGRVTQTRDVLKNLQSDTQYEWTTSAATDWTKTQTVSPPSGVTGLTFTSAYAVRTTATVKPAATTYYDRLGRVIRTIKDGFAGQQTVTDTIYNTLGQVVATSLPYKAGTHPAAIFWTQTTYDPLGRVVTVTAPNGTITTNWYKGRINWTAIAATDRDPQTNVTYVDAKGRTIAVWNADNVPALTPIAGSNAAYSASLATASIEFRLDGFGRMRDTRLKDQTALISATYDALGRQTSLNDPDKGPWSYVNNALGQVVTQTDAKLNVTASTFDRLGRPLTRTTTEPANGPVETAKWYYYDTPANVALYPHLVAKGDQGWIGAPQREEAQTTGAPGYTAPPTQKAYYYDNKGRPAITLNTVDSKWFYTHTDFDTYSRPIATHHYWRPPAHELPSDQPYVWQNFGYTYTYDGSGASSKSYLMTMGDTAGRTWWQADSTNGYDHLDRPVLVRKGSGHWTQRTYNLLDGTLLMIRTAPTISFSPTAAGSIQHLLFSYDGLGNLTQRIAPGLTETFTYDDLNRLTDATMGAIVSYYPNGNIATKDDGTGNSSDYYYSTTKPHAVTSAFGYTMGYDPNGNLLTRSDGQTTWSTHWAGFDKPRWLAKTTGETTTGSEFTYDANRSRVLHLEFDAMASAGNGNVPSHYTRKKVYGLGSTLEVDYKNTATSGTPTWQMDKIRIYVPGPEGIAGTMEYSPFAPPDQDERPLVYHYDHLGSIESITPYGSTATATALDDAGRASRFSYAAWGERRNASSWSGAPVNTSHGGHDGLTPRGYTGHEMLDGLDLVHMNGRIYDPLLGRFLSADTFVQDAGDLQAYNRYSYVRNNPTSLNDPSGHFWSALITVGFAAYDTYNYATGKTTGAEYAKNMALNGAALVADVATAGQGGGLAVRAANAGIRVAKAVDKANDAYETVSTMVETGKVVASGDSGEISRAVVTNLVEHVVGGGKGKHDVDLNKNKVHADVDAGKKVDPRTSPATEAQDVAKGGTYKLRDPDTGDVKRTGRTNDHDRRRSEHGETGTETEGLDYEVDTRTDDYAEQRGREGVIHDQHPEARHPDHVEGGTDGGLNKKRAIAPDNPRRSEYEETERLRAEREKNKR